MGGTNTEIKNSEAGDSREAILAELWLQASEIQQKIAEMQEELGEIDKQTKALAETKIPIRVIEKQPRPDSDKEGDEKIIPFPAQAPRPENQPIPKPLIVPEKQELPKAAQEKPVGEKLSTGEELFSEDGKKYLRVLQGKLVTTH